MANRRPPDTTTPGSTVQGKRIPRFGKRTEQMEQEGEVQAPYSQISNKYQGKTNGDNHPTSTNSPSDSSLSRVARSHDSHSGIDMALREPPNPSNLGSCYRGESFGHTDVGCKEVIKLSIEYSGNDIALFSNGS